MMTKHPKYAGIYQSAKKIYVTYTLRGSLHSTRFLHHPALSSAYIAAGVRVFFMYRIGAFGRSRGSYIRMGALTAHAMLLQRGIDHRAIVAGWIEAERRAGFLLGEIETKRLRIGNQRADIRV